MSNPYYDYNRLSPRPAKPTGLQKLKYAAVSALMFALISAPDTYRLTQSLLGDIVHLANAQGRPTGAGLLAHALVYLMLIYGLMHVRI